MAGEENVGRCDWFVNISECCTTDILSFVVFNHDGTFFDYARLSLYNNLKKMCEKVIYSVNFTLSGRASKVGYFHWNKGYFLS